MSAVTIQQMTERVEDLMQRRLGVKGKDLADRVHRGRRLLPRKVRLAADALAHAQTASHNPKLLLQLDEEAVAKDYDICVRYLSNLNRRERIKGILLSLTATILFSLVGVVALVIGVLVWRGYM